MTVNLVQWRGVIRNFNCSSSAVSYQVCNLTKNFAFILKFCFIAGITLKVLFFSYQHWYIYLLFYNVTGILKIIVRADNPDNIKKGGVCIYYRESLPVQVISLPCFKEALL